MKMEIELTEAQAEKVELLKENGIEVGEAIDMFFDMRDSLSKSTNEILDRRINEATQQKALLEEQLANIEKDLEFFDKVKNETPEPINKQKMVEKEYGMKTKTYDETIMDTRHHVKWSKFFKF